jgi:glutathione S-transferase
MNLPYVLDGDHVIAQTNACFSHLGRVLGLYGSTYAETVAVEQCLCQVMDLRNDAVGKFYGGSDDNFAGHLKSIAGHYEKFELFLVQQGKGFLATDTPTAPDFHVFEMLDQHEALAKFTKSDSPLAAFPLLTKYYEAFKALPTLQAYFNGPLNQLPANNKMAAWGARPDGSTW